MHAERPEDGARRDWSYTPRLRLVPSHVAKFLAQHLLALFRHKLFAHPSHHRAQHPKTATHTPHCTLPTATRHAVFVRPQEKKEIMVATGIELKQLTNWFLNNRKRFWKPLVDAMHAEPMMKPRMVRVSSCMQHVWQRAWASDAADREACGRHPAPPQWSDYNSTPRAGRTVPAVRSYVRGMCACAYAQSPMRGRAGTCCMQSAH